MTQPINKYELLMKVLEIIERDGALSAGSAGREHPAQITNVIHQLDGDLVQQIEPEEVSVGDRFARVHESTIATRGSFAHSVVALGATHGDELAGALQTMESALHGAPGAALPAEQRKDALEILHELAQHGVKPDSSKSVLRTLGKGLWTLIGSAEPLTRACAAAWHIVQKFVGLDVSDPR